MEGLFVTHRLRKAPLAPTETTQVGQSELQLGRSSRRGAGSQWGVVSDLPTSYEEVPPCSLVRVSAASDEVG